MNIFQVLFYPITPEESEQFRLDYDPTPAELAEQMADDIQTQIEHLAPHAHRESWFSEDGLTLFWEETVIVNGHKYVTDSGNHYCGRSVYAGHEE